MSESIDLGKVDAMVERIGRSREATIPLLQAIEHAFHYLPEAALRRVCERTSIPPAELAGVSTFYAQFRHRPAGRHMIRVCVGTACHVKGGEAVCDAFRQHLGIAAGSDTDADRLFTVEQAACLGCCMLAPAVQIDTVIYGFVDRDKVPGILRDFLASATPSAARAAAPPGGSAATGEIRMCTCSSCAAAGADAVLEAFRREAAAYGPGLRVTTVGCTGISYETPLVEITATDGHTFRYGRIQPDDVGTLLRRHFRPRGVPRRVRAAVSGLLDRLFSDETWEPVTRYAVDLRQGPSAAYWGRQCHLVTEHAGQLHPLDLAGTIERGGFTALRRCREGLTPDAVIEEVARSGLRGRGGAGFAAMHKWRTVQQAPDATKYVVCNADEGDPGAFMDRMILESFPFRVIEGMLIAAHAVGAREGFIYVRREYPLAVARLRQALALCAEHGFTGAHALGRDRPFPIHVSEGAGAFVCGEETALLAALEGRRGMPRYRPPFPAQHGLRGQPTLVNNVETFALVPWILRHGAAAFVTLGTHGSKGTKTFALAGKVQRGGLIEVPMGTTLREIVEDIGGGVQDGGRLKAVQVGGPSGGCVPAALADTPVDYEALLSTGAMMGSGGLVVLDEADCMVDIARYFLAFTQHESCGKCTHGRIGTKRMLEILDRLCEGRAQPDDLDRLQRVAEITRRGSLCGLGRSAPNPVLSTLQHFRAEYEAHLAGRCPARKCRALIHYRISDRCIGCTRCAQRCPVDAIAPRPYEQHEVDANTCVRCGTCRAVCPADAVEVVTGNPDPTGGAA